jgi:hypothetical protein
VRGDHRLQIVDLDMVPDPVAERAANQRFVLRLRADGINEIVIEPYESWCFSRNEHCFVVLADIAGTARPVDASQQFCARQIAGAVGA